MPPTTEFQGSFLSRISLRRTPTVSIYREQELENPEDFQKHVSEHFSELLSQSPASPYNAVSQPPDQILSISWLLKLLDVFMSCETEFKTILTTSHQISKSPLDTIVPEMLDRIVKALDICTAVVSGIDSVRQTQKLAEITVTALKKRPLCDGTVRRAKRALTSLLITLNAEGKYRNSSSGRKTVRSWSFGQRSTGDGGSSGGGGFVNKNWSVVKQIQGMVANLVPPRGAEALGPALPIYIMSNVMVLVMWVLVAAVPCQTSNVLAAYLPLPKHQNWASGPVNIHERIGEELKRKEKRGSGVSGGVMNEMERMEKVGLALAELTERFRFPAEEEEEIAENVAEMEEICGKMEEGLDGLQRQVRQVFHRLVETRGEILTSLDQARKASARAI